MKRNGFSVSISSFRAKSRRAEWREFSGLAAENEEPEAEFSETAPPPPRILNRSMSPVLQP